MKILLVGGTGLVGQVLGRRLADVGHELFLSVRSGKKDLPFPCQFIEADFAGEYSSGVKLPELDAVINLAGENVAAKRWTSDRKAQLMNSRVKLTANLISKLRALQKPISVYIGASAVGYYGDSGDEVLSETSLPGQDFLAKLCVDWEEEHMNASELADRVVIFRIGVVLSQQGGALEKMRLPFSLGLGARLGSGHQWMSWVHIEDLISMIEMALQSKSFSAGVYNAVSPQAVTNQEFSVQLARSMGKSFLLEKGLAPPVPALGLKLALGELSQVLLSSQRAEANKIQSCGFRFRFESLAAALSDVNSPKY